MLRNSAYSIGIAGSICLGGGLVGAINSRSEMRDGLSQFESAHLVSDQTPYPATDLDRKMYKKLTFDPYVGESGLTSLTPNQHEFLTDAYESKLDYDVFINLMGAGAVLILPGLVCIANELNSCAAQKNIR